MNGVAFLGPIGALGGIALAMVLGRFTFWVRYFARREAEPVPADSPPGDPIVEIARAGRSSAERAKHLAGELLSSSSRRMVMLDGVASLAALLGLAGTFIALRGPFEPDRLTWALGPMLSGLAVFVFVRAALALFQSWQIALHLEIAFALQSPMPAPVEPRELPAPESARRPARRPWIPSARGGRGLTLRGGVAFAACLIGSLLFHGGIFMLARHLGASATGAAAGESDGVFHASLVAAHPAPEPPRLEARREEPPPPPEPAPVPPPPPVPKEEPAVPEPPKPQPEPQEKVSEEARPAAVKEEPAPVPAPKPPPPPVPAETAQEREATPPEPPPPAESKVKETAAPAAVEPPPAPRYTEVPKQAAKAPEPASAPEAAAAPVEPAAEAPAPSAGASPALGFGRKPPETAEGTSAGSSKAAGVGIASIGDYRRFLSREMKPGSAEGQYVPNLRFGDNQAQENREIMRYFGMELIAYPKDQKFYVYIEPEQGLYSRSNDFSYIRNFSTRVIFRTSPYFDSLRAEAARRVGVESSSLAVAQLLKPSSAAYIGWKERECARRAGVALEDVEACDATFAKTPFGVWIVRIERLLLKGGQSLPIQDFEWARVSSGQGDER